MAWRVTRERVLVWLRLAEPAERAVGEVDRARKIARLTRAAWRYHSLASAGAAGWRVRRAAAVLRRHTLAGVEHLALGDDDQARDAVRRSLATLYQVTARTAPDALAHMTPWADRPAVQPVAVVRGSDRTLPTELPTDLTPADPAVQLVQARDGGADRAPVSTGGPVGGSQTDRAYRAATDHRAAHGTLPTTTELVRLTRVSRGTAGTVLKGLRLATGDTTTSTSDAPPTSAPGENSDPIQQQHKPEPDQSEPTPDDQPTHPPSKIQNQYTPMHHDPEEDQQRSAGTPAGLPVEPAGVR